MKRIVLQKKVKVNTITMVEQLKTIEDVKKAKGDGKLMWVLTAVRPS